MNINKKHRQYIIMMMINMITTSHVFSAVVVNNKNNMNITTNPVSNKGIETYDWMKPKNGKVLVFDKKQNIAIINKKSYLLQESTKVYDGIIKKGSNIRFNTNEKNIITEIWVLK